MSAINDHPASSNQLSEIEREKQFRTTVRCWLCSALLFLNQGKNLNSPDKICQDIIEILKAHTTNLSIDRIFYSLRGPAAGRLCRDSPAISAEHPLTFKFLPISSSSKFSARQDRFSDNPCLPGSHHQSLPSHSLNTRSKVWGQVWVF